MPLKELEQLINSTCLERPVTVQRLVHDVLKEAIINGSLRENESIKTEEVAELFKVSRMPVREALRGLASEGLVYFEPYKGARVMATSVKEIIELAEVRIVLEKLALQHLFPLNEKKVKFMESSLESAKKELESGLSPMPVLQTINSEFHMRLFADIDQKTLLENLNNLIFKMKRYTVLLSDDIQTKSLILMEHQEIFDFCKKADMEKTCKCLEDHITNFKNRISYCLK